MLADDAVRRAYMELSGKPVRDLKAAAQQAKQRPLDSNDCPICFDALSAQVRAGTGWRLAHLASAQCTRGLTLRLAVMCS